MKDGFVGHGHPQEEPQPGKTKQRIQFAVVVAIFAVCIGAWANHRYGDRWDKIPDIEVDPQAKEVGVAFSDWHWENRYQLYCEISCAKDDFINYEVRYVPYGPGGEELPGGVMTYKPLRAGQNGSGTMKFNAERNKLVRLKIILVKSTG